MKRKDKWFDSFQVDMIFLEQDDKFKSGYGVDAKWVGNALDDILFYMDEHNIRIIPELQELKQFLRFKGNSRREQGDFRYWITNKKKDKRGLIEDGK